MPQTLVERKIFVCEAAAVELVLNVSARVVAGHPPALLSQRVLLVSVDRQAGAGQRELQQEQEEEDDHILGKGQGQHRPGIITSFVCLTAPTSARLAVATVFVCGENRKVVNFLVCREWGLSLVSGHRDRDGLE